MNLAGVWKPARSRSERLQAIRVGLVGINTAVAFNGFVGISTASFVDGLVGISTAILFAAGVAVR